MCRLTDWAHTPLSRRIRQDMQSAPSLTGVVPTMCGSANHESTAHTSLFVPNKASTAEQKQGAKHGGFAEECEARWTQFCSSSDANASPLLQRAKSSAADHLKFKRRGSH
jgi:hypothetical protein